MGEEVGRGGEVFRLHEPAAFADIGPQGMRCLRGVERGGREIGIRRGLPAEIDELQPQGRPAMAAADGRGQALRARGERRMSAVAVGDDRRRQRPGNREGRIVERHARFRLGDVGPRVAVDDLAVVGERLKAVGEALGDQECAAVFRREPFGMPLEKRRRIGPQVHGHVVDLATDARHEPGLGVRRGLVVEAADRAAIAGDGMIHLHGAEWKTVGGECVGRPEPGEFAAVVGMPPPFDEAEAVEGEGREREAAHAEPASADAGTSGVERIGLKSTLG